MKFSDLDQAYEIYKQDPSTIHDLFSACLDFAKVNLSIHIISSDREDVAQDATWAAWATLPTLKHNQLFSFWFLGILVKSRDAYLSKKIFSTPVVECVQ